MTFINKPSGAIYLARNLQSRMAEPRELKFRAIGGIAAAMPIARCSLSAEDGGDAVRSRGYKMGFFGCGRDDEMNWQGRGGEELDVIEVMGVLWFGV